MQLWFPSSLTEPLSPHSEVAAKSVDPELEFDKEVYPIGISLAEVAIIGGHPHGLTITVNFAELCSLRPYLIITCPPVHVDLQLWAYVARHAMMHWRTISCGTRSASSDLLTRFLSAVFGL